MINQTLPAVAVYVFIAASCVALLALAAALVVLCLKNRAALAAREDEESGTTSILRAQPHPLGAVDASTDGFHPALVVGKGPLGTVYVSVSASGEKFAMKRIHPHLVLSNAGLRFASRIKSLSFAVHPNVVPVVGYSEAPGERIVISEFVAGARSLEYYLHGPAAEPTPMQLDWRARVRIAAGTARGLEHLHEVQGVVHGRVKPSNIMVDHSFTARVCDYGLSFLSPGGRRGPEDEGYADGEGREEASRANDVYALGVVLVELLSGRRVGEWGASMGLVREGRVGEAMDRRIGLPKDMRMLVRMAKVASACVGNGRRSRPTVSQVAAILSSLEMEGKLTSTS